MTAPGPLPFSGLRVVLVAAFNRRYHQSGLALAAALGSLGCEVRRCEERARGLGAILRRPLAGRLGAMLRRAPTDLVLVFKGTKLEPTEVVALKREGGGRWVNWFPDDPHELAVSLALAPAYDAFFTHDSSSVERHRTAGHRAHYLAFGCDPEFHRPLDGAGAGARRSYSWARGIPRARPSCGPWPISGSWPGDRGGRAAPCTGTTSRGHSPAPQSV